jgi:DNA polymerase III gamma/tau subunit
VGQGEKYRPATWDELVGNGATAARTLRAIEDKHCQDRPFGSLFASETRRGKSTLAQKLARELGCYMERDANCATPNLYVVA